MKVRTLQEFMREQANAATRISGAHHSSWNGRLRNTTPADGDVRGVAEWDHTIAYSRESVDEPLNQMFQYAGHYNQDAESLRSYREAVKTVLHENVHLLAGEGTDHAQAKTAFCADPGVRQAEEGFTELYSQQQLDRYIDDLGLAEISPGINEADAAVAYKKYLPAAERVAEDIGRTTGLGSEEVARRMATVTADQKFRTAAELIYDHSELPGMIPSQERDAAVQRIADAMGPEFARTENIAGTDPLQRRRESAIAGAASMNAARGVVRDLRRAWSMPAPDQRIERGLGAEQNRGAEQTRGAGQAPGGAQTRGADQAPGSEQSRGGRQGGGPAQGPLPQETRSPDLPPEIAAAARAGLSGPPLTSAGRLGPDRQGASRPTETTPAAQRQRPETQR